MVPRGIAEQCLTASVVRESSGRAPVVLVLEQSCRTATLYEFICNAIQTEIVTV